MYIPENCKDCVYMKIIIRKNDEREFQCMLGHSLLLANGCPNKTKNLVDFSNLD